MTDDHDTYADASHRYDLIDRLVKRRKELGLNQKQVAAAMGVGQSTVSDFEKNGSDPRLSTIQRYVRALEAQLHVTLQPMIHVIEVRNAELMETLNTEIDRLGITNAVMTLIGGVDAFTVSVMPPGAAKDDIVMSYDVPGELTGTGEVHEGDVHVHAVLGVAEGNPAVAYVNRTIAGHLHSADVRTHYVRAYVQPR